MEQIDPIGELHRLSGDYYNMTLMYHDSAYGHRDKLYSLMKKCYQVIRQLSDSPSDYQRLKEDEFWNNSRQKPKDEFIAKWVLYYTMQAQCKVVRDRAGKCARVLDSFLREGVPTGEIDTRLRVLGGIDKIYAKVCADEPRTELKFDDLELLKPATPDQINDEREGFEDEVTREKKSFDATAIGERRWRRGESNGAR